MSFICQDCKDQKHEECRGGTWCDCLHRSFRVGPLYLTSCCEVRSASWTRSHVL